MKQSTEAMNAVKQVVPVGTGVSSMGGRTLMAGALAFAMVGGVQDAFALGVTGEKIPAATAPDALEAALPSKSFAIAPGPLDVAIRQYEAATGLTVKTTMTPAVLAGFNSGGVTGTYPAGEALRILLDGTGLQFHLEGTSTLVVGLRSQQTVNVTTNPNSVALTQFTEPLIDVPQTVNVIPQFIMQEQAVTSLRDGLRNAPGISLAAGEGGAQGDNLTIRGFSARNDIFLDGIRDFGSYYRDSFDYEAIEVLQGPASVEFGRGSTGGVVNQESKLPHLHEGINASLQLGTNLMRRVTADVNEPLPTLGQGAAFRLNVVGSQSKVAERDVAENRRFGIAPSLAFGLGKPTRYTINYLHESENSTPDYGLPYFLNVVAPVNRRNYYGFANDNYLRTNPDVVTGKVEHDFTLPINLRSALRWGNYPRDVRITEPQIPSTAVFSTVGGVRMVACPPPACYPSNYDINQVQVRRAQIPVKSVEDILWNQTSATARMHRRGIENSVVVMVEGGRERSNPQRTTYTVANTTAVNPNPNDPFAPTVTPTLGAKSHVLSTAFGVNALDTLKLTAWLQLSGGLRFDYFNTNQQTDAVGTTAAINISRLDKKPTYRAAIVVKPRQNGSVYFDYGTSFNPSGESLSLSANNATAPPELNSTTEFGTKWDFLRDRLNVSGSYFSTEKQNARETDPNNTLNTINVGTQLVRGAQVAIIGHLPRHLDILAGYAYLNGRVESSILNASPFSSQYIQNDPIYGNFPYFFSPKGFPFANVPKNSGNLWVTHDLLWHFVGGFGGNYVSARRASSTAIAAVYNSVTPVPVTSVPMAFKSIPGYIVFNALIRRPISDHVDFQANLQNLTNKFYIDQPHPNHLVPGEGFNAQIGFNYKF